MDFARVLQLVDGFFVESKRPYGVIGAIGVAAYGVSRTTFDIDFIAHRNDQREIIAFLESTGYTTEHCSSGYSNHVHEDPDLGRVDVVYVGGDTATQIFDGLTTRPGPGETVIPIPRAEHLAAMKLYGIKNNPRRVAQDLEDIQKILDLPNVDADEIRSYFDRYGLEALRDRIE
jgi:hypothetical protein